MSGFRNLLGITLAAVVFDTVVYAMLIPMLPAYRAALDLGQTASGLVLSSYAVGLIIAIPLLALFTDRLNRERVLLTGVVGLLLAALLYPVAASLSTLVLARLIQGAASAAVWTAGLALIAERCPTHRRGAVFGWVMTGFSVGMMAGPPIGGFAGDRIGSSGAFALLAIVAIMLSVAAWRWLELSHQVAKPFQVPVRRLLGDGATPGLCLIVAAVALVMGLLEPTLPPWLETIHGTSATVIGLMFGLLALAFGLGSVLGGSLADRLGAAPIIGVGGGLLLLVLPLFPLLPSPGLVATLFAAIGLLAGVTMAPTLPALAARIDSLDGRSYAFIYALFNLSMAVGLAAGPAAGAVLAEHFGLQAALLTVSLTLAPLLGGVRVLARRL